MDGFTFRQLLPGDQDRVFELAANVSTRGSGVAARHAALREGIVNGYEDYGWMRNDPDLAALRGTPNFVALTGGQ